LENEKISDLEVINADGNLIVKSKGKNVLQYNLKEAPLPDGVSALYDRAGYIHPCGLLRAKYSRAFSRPIITIM
jgi:hypothetical protein